MIRLVHVVVNDQVQAAVDAMRRHVLGCTVCQEATGLMTAGKLMENEAGVRAAFCSIGADLLGALGLEEQKAGGYFVELQPLEGNRK